jgi:alkaline phosphatase D
VDEYHTDKWDGYLAARDRLFQAVRKADVQGLIGLAGDVHNNWAGTLRANFDDPASEILGHEFVSTSISSGGDGEDDKKSQQRIVDANPHIAFFNGQRGYLRCTVGRNEWRTDYRVVPYVSKPGAPISTRASFVVDRETHRMAEG